MKTDDHTESEASYRRGFEQGYFFALEDVKAEGECVAEARLKKLTEWRFEGDLTKRDSPPAIE